MSGAGKMRSVRTAGVGVVETVRVPRPTPGPRDALVRVRACGICGTDVTFLHMGGFPTRAHAGGELRPIMLGHEPAGEVVADAVIDSAAEDVTARLKELHGTAANALGQPAAATDVYLDAAGVPAVINTAVASAKWHAKLVMVAVQKPSDKLDLGGMLRSELTLIASQGYPTEIFEVTPQLVEHQERFARIISHRVPFSEADRAFKLALTPGAADKVVVTLDEADAS